MHILAHRNTKSKKSAYFYKSLIIRKIFRVSRRIHGRGARAQFLWKGAKIVMQYKILYAAYYQYPEVAKLIYKKRRWIIINTAAYAGANIIRIYPNN